MRNSIKTLLAGAVMLAGLAQAGLARAADSGFEVINVKHGESIQAVWIAGSGTNDPWSSISLSSPVGPGGVRDFSTESSVCFFDVKVLFSDSTTQVFSNINVCRNDKVIGT